MSASTPTAWIAAAQSLILIKEDEMLKPRSRKRRKSSSSSPWEKAKNFLFFKSGALKENSEPEPESTDWLICPHDTTNGLGSKRRAGRKPSGKTPAHIL